MHAKSLQSCLTLCNHKHCGLPGSSAHGILQGKILEWVAMPSSWGSSQQGIFPTQGSNLHLLHLLHWQAGSLPLAPPGKSPKSGYKAAKKKSENTSCHFLLHRREGPTTRCLTSQRAWKNGGLHAERHCPQTSLFSVPLRKARLIDLESAHPQDTAQSCFPPRALSAIPPTPCPASESSSGT